MRIRRIVAVIGAVMAALLIGIGVVSALASAQAAQPDLNLTLTDSPDPVPLGGQLVYTVGVTNAGTAGATNLTVTHSIPTAATFVGATGTGWTCSFTAPTLTCTMPAVGGGQAAQSIVVSVTAPNVATSLSSAATVSMAETDPTTANNSATATTAVAAGTDMALAKSDTPDPVAPGGQLAYTLSVTNNGPQAATNIVLTDTLPQGVAFVSAVGSAWACALSGPTVSCNRASLPSGQTASVIITVTAPGAAGTLSNSATVTATEADPNVQNNTALASTAVGQSAPQQPRADISVGVSDTPDPVALGSNVTHTITVKNSGPDQAANVMLLARRWLRTP